MKRYVELLKLTGFEPEGAGVSAEEATEYYLAWWWTCEKLNLCQHPITESRQQQLSQLIFIRLRVSVCH